MILKHFSRFSRVSLLLTFILCVCSVFLPSSVGTAEAAVVPMERTEVIQRSELIFVGEVVEQQSRWNSQGNLIVTDYTFRVDDILHGNAGGLLTLQFAGGVLDVEGHSVDGVPSFSTGDQGLFFIEDSQRALLSPITGLHQGLYLASDDASLATSRVVDYRGQTVTAQGAPMDFASFVEQVRAEIPVALSKPLPDRQVAPQFQHLIIPAESTMVYDDSTRSAVAGEEAKRPRSPEPTPAPPSVTGTDGASETGEDGTTASQPAAYSFSYLPESLPIVFNPLPAGGLIGLHDQYAMAYWNEYADIFRVMTSTGTWAWGNNRYDFAGFVSNSVMISQFGQGWGSSTLAVCWTRFNTSTGHRLEADIAMNPAFSWTTDDFAAYYDVNLHNADQTILHEVGHSWGANHEWYQLSVMNYAPHRFRSYAVLYRDDVNGARAAFPSAAVGRTDLGVHLFRSSGFRSYTAASLNQTTLSPGDTLTVSSFSVENTGTVTVSPSIAWYLVDAVGSFAGAVYIGTTNHSSLGGGSWYLTNRSLVIPNTVPNGTYYLAAHVANSSDSVAFNDSSWIDVPITVGGCQDDAWEPDDTCSQARSFPVGTARNLNHCDRDWLEFDVVPGATYRVETSNLVGGADTVLELWNGGCSAMLDIDDDGGSGLASRLDHVAASSGTLNVLVREYADSYAPGEAYRVSVQCTANCSGSGGGRSGTDLIGLGITSNAVYYSIDLASWINIPGALRQAAAGDFDGDGIDELAGIGNSGIAYVSLDLATWSSLGFVLDSLVVGDFNGDNVDDVAGLDGGNRIWYSVDLSTWNQVPGLLETLVVGDWDGDGRDELAGLSPTDRVYYTNDMVNWINIPGSLTSLVAGDFDGGGWDEVAGISPTGRVYYTEDMVRWIQIPGSLSTLVSGDFNGDGTADLAGLSAAGRIYYSNNRSTWTQIPGYLNTLVVGDYDGGGWDELAGTTTSDRIYYTFDMSSWIAMPGALTRLASGELDGQ